MERIEIEYSIIFDGSPGKGSVEASLTDEIIFSTSIEDMVNFHIETCEFLPFDIVNSRILVESLREAADRIEREVLERA